MLVLFFILLIGMMYFFYELNRRDVISPTFLLVLGYVITAVGAIYNQERWRSEIELIVLLVVFIGIVSFALSELFVSKIKKKKNLFKGNTLAYQLSSINTMDSKFKCVVLSIICAILTYFIYKEVVRIAYVDFKEWGNLLYNFKSNLANNSMNSIARYGFRFTKAVAFVYSFIFMNIITEQKRITLKIILRNIIYIIPIVIYSIQSILTGGRIGILMLLIGIFFFYSILKFYKTGYRWKPNIKNLVKILFFGVVVCILFFEVQELIGRQQKSIGVLDYIMTYVGGSFDLFSQYVRNPMGKQDEIMTFTGIIDSLQRYFGLLKNVVICTSSEFRTSNTGVLIGNTYSAFRNYYNDGGILGTIVFSSLLSIIFTSMYHSIIRIKRLSYKKIVLICFYATILYSLLFHFFTDYFFSTISVGMVIDILFIIMVVRITIENKALNIQAKE